MVAAEISGMTLEVAEGEGSRVLVHGAKVRLGKMEHSIELVREKNRAALVSFYQRHNSEKLSEKEEDGTPVIGTILSRQARTPKPLQKPISRSMMLHDAAAPQRRS